MEKWYKHSFFRNLVDMHISDDDPSYLSKFNAEEYAHLVSLSGADTAILYTSNCLGLTYFDTEARHGCMPAGRDFVKERIDAFKKYGVRTILYFNIWNRRAALLHPEWRIVSANPRLSQGRFLRCCLNSEGYRAQVRRQLETLSHRYEFEGIWIDMIDWYDMICVCPDCRKKLLSEEGIEIPDRLCYSDPAFAKFRRARERWLTEFMDLVRDAVHSGNPAATVTLQNACWNMGFTAGISEQSMQKSEFLAGDFYADPLSYSVICKFLASASENRPIEFMTSLCSELQAHTTSKTEKELLRTLYGSIAHNTAFTFIDAIDPIGTMNESRYRRMRRLYEKTQGERARLAPDARLLSDLTVYTNHESLFDPEDIPLSAHLREGRIAKTLKNIAKTLIEHHVAFDVNVKKNLAMIDSAAILLPDRRILGKEEVAALTEYVERGGTLIATAMTGTLTGDGKQNEDFALSELLGVHYVGTSAYDSSYLRRANPAVKEFKDYDEGYPVAVLAPSALVRAEEDTEVLSYLTLPLSSSTDENRFSSAISDPPVTDTEYPAITRRRVGKGQAIYIAAPLEESPHEDAKRLLTALLPSESERKIRIQAPAWLEVLVYDDEANGRYLVNCLSTAPCGYEAAAENVCVTLKTNEKIASVYNVTENRAVEFEQNEETLVLKIGKVNDFCMVTAEKTQK